METREKVIARPAAWSEAAHARLSACLDPKVDTSGGLATLEDVCAGGQLFELVRERDVLANYVVRVNEYEHGLEAVIVAAAGRAPGIDLTVHGIRAAERQFAHCDVLAAITRRPHLARKLGALGFAFSGFVLRKRLRLV